MATVDCYFAHGVYYKKINAKGLKGLLLQLLTGQKSVFAQENLGGVPLPRTDEKPDVLDPAVQKEVQQKFKGNWPHAEDVIITSISTITVYQHPK